MSGSAERTSRARGDGGAAIVEFAFISILLSLLVFGIINFGLILSFKQDMTRAAAEGARAGAVEFPFVAPDTSTSTPSTSWTAARDATYEAVGGFNRTCNSGDGLTCNINLHDCTTPVPAGTASNPLSNGDCVTVELVYDYENHPLLAKLPILGGVLPETIRDSSVARLNS